jgi:hypothetical protein
MNITGLFPYLINDDQLVFVDFTNKKIYTSGNGLKLLEKEITDTIFSKFNWQKPQTPDIADLIDKIKKGPDVVKEKIPDVRSK